MKNYVRFFQILIIIISYLFTGLVAYLDGIDKADVNNRIRFHAIPVAISQIYHNHMHDYTSSARIASIFANPNINTNDAIFGALNSQLTNEDGVYYWVADDRGSSDFVNLSFRLFGANIPALFYFYFLLLAIAILFAVFRNRNNFISLGLISITIISIVSVMPLFSNSIPEATISTGMNVINISETRMFDLLGLISFVDITLLIITCCKRQSTILVELFYIVPQILMLDFLVNCRTSVSYLFLAIIFICISYALVDFITGLLKVNYKNLAIVIIFITIGWSMVPLYQNVMFNDAYKGGQSPRTFWHNVLMGLKYNHVLSRYTGVTLVDDANAIDAVIAKLKAENSPILNETWERQNILNSLGSYNYFDWQSYEKVARSIVIDAVMANPMAAISLLTKDKLTEIFHITTCRYLRIEKWCYDGDYRIMNKRGLLFLLTITGIFICFCLNSWLFFIALFMDNKKEDSFNREEKLQLFLIQFSMIVALLFSLMPAELIYPAPTQLAGFFALLLLNLFLAALVLLIFLYLFYLKLKHNSSGSRILP